MCGLLDPVCGPWLLDSGCWSLCEHCSWLCVVDFVSTHCSWLLDPVCGAGGGWAKCHLPAPQRRRFPNHPRYVEFHQPTPYHPSYVEFRQLSLCGVPKPPSYVEFLSPFVCGVCPLGRKSRNEPRCGTPHSVGPCAQGRGPRGRGRRVLGGGGPYPNGRLRGGGRRGLSGGRKSPGCGLVSSRIPDPGSGIPYSGPLPLPRKTRVYFPKPNETLTKHHQPTVP